MKRTFKLKKNYEFRNTLKKGKYFGGELLEVFWMKNHKNVNYLGIAISAKLCNAVKRNKIKRIIREAYRKSENHLKTGNTFVFLWKKKADIKECNYYNVLKDMIKIFKKMDLYIDEENND